jgi:peptide-methionine (R)-S-oxide reductase
MFSCKGQNPTNPDKEFIENHLNKKDPMKFEVTKTEEEWQKTLTPDQYYVLRQKGTERAWTGDYNKLYDNGVYKCSGCKRPLFMSDSKYDSGSGWPSFDQCIEGSVLEIKDSSHGMVRTEILCAKCGGHLGHVFDDGPSKTTGLRYCTNSISLEFEPKK